MSPPTPSTSCDPPAADRPPCSSPSAGATDRAVRRRTKPPRWHGDRGRRRRRRAAALRLVPRAVPPGVVAPVLPAAAVSDGQLVPWEGSVISVPGTRLQVRSLMEETTGAGSTSTAARCATPIKVEQPTDLRRAALTPPPHSTPAGSRPSTHDGRATMPGARAAATAGRLGQAGHPHRPAGVPTHLHQAEFLAARTSPASPAGRSRDRGRPGAPRPHASGRTPGARRDLLAVDLQTDPVPPRVAGPRLVEALAGRGDVVDLLLRRAPAPPSIAAVACRLPARRSAPRPHRARMPPAPARCCRRCGRCA